MKWMYQRKTRKDQRSRVVGALGVIGCLLALTACGSNGGGGSGGSADATPAPSGTTPKGTITVLVQGTAENVKEYAALNKLFNKEYPEVKVKYINDPSTTWDAFIANAQVKISGGQKIDLVYMPTEGQRMIASKGIIQPLDAWMKRDSAAIKNFEDDASPVIMKDIKNYGSPDGKTYFLPALFNTEGLFYNKKMFADAGLQPPTANWTWQDLYTAAKALTKNGNYGFYATTSYFDGPLPFLATNGAWVMNDQWTKGTMNTPEAAQALAFPAKLVKEKISPVPGGTYDAPTQAAKNKLAMWVCGRWCVAPLRTLHAATNFGIVPMPSNDGTSASPIGIGAYGMLKASTNKEAAWAYIKFTLSQQAQDYIAESGFQGANPARRSSATGPKALADSPSGSAYLYQALDNSKVAPAPNQGAEIQQDVIDTYTQILLGQVDSTSATTQLNSKINAAMAKK